MAAAVERGEIGQYRGVKIELVTVDATGAQVDLSCACMFTHEVDHQPLAGGLANLDAALGGQLAQARRDGAFRAQPLETLLITPPAGAAQAAAILVIGMGHPEDWSPATSAAAVACALRVGQLRNARSIAIAPSILDTGIHSDEDVNGPSSMRCTSCTAWGWRPHLRSGTGCLTPVPPTTRTSCSSTSKRLHP